jgi:hypothetical protein
MSLKQKLTGCLGEVESLPDKGQLKELREKAQIVERLPDKGQLKEFQGKVQAAECLPGKGTLNGLRTQLPPKPLKQGNLSSQVGGNPKLVEPQVVNYIVKNFYGQVGNVADYVTGNQVTSLIQDGEPG